MAGGPVPQPAADRNDRRGKSSSLLSALVWMFVIGVFVYLVATDNLMSRHEMIRRMNRPRVEQRQPVPVRTRTRVSPAGSRFRQSEFRSGDNDRSW